MRFSLTSILIFFSFASFAQIEFYKQFSETSGYDYGEGIDQTEDTSYFVTGSSSSFTDGPADAYLLKVDSIGEFLWSNHYGGDYTDVGRRVHYIEDDGVYIAGYTNSFGAGAYDFYLVKTDVDGNSLWENTYGSASWERLHDAVLASDSGMVMVGETKNSIDGSSDIFIVRTDKEGVELWRRQIGAEGDDVAKTILPTSDTTFAIGGAIYNSDSTMQKGFLLHLQDDNTILLQDTLGNDGEFIINTFAMHPNELVCGGMSVGASTSTLGDTVIGFQRVNLTDWTSSELLETTEGIKYCVGMLPHATDEFIMVASTNDQYSFGEEDIYAYQFGSWLGWIANRANVAYDNMEYLGQIYRTNDDGFIMVGTVETSGEGGANIYLLKVHPGSGYVASDGNLTTESYTSLVDIGSNEDGVQVFPNPVDNKFIVQVESEYFSNQICQLQLYSVMGEKVYNKDFHNSVTISRTPKMQSGVYFLQIENADGKKITKKLVFQ